MVVLHALSEFLIMKPPPEDLSLDVDVRIRGRKEIRYHFDPSSAYAARSSRVSDALQQQLNLFVITFSLFYYSLFVCSCLLTLIWKWRLEGTERVYSRYKHGVIWFPGYFCKILPNLPNTWEFYCDLISFITVFVFDLFSSMVSPGCDALQPATRGWRGEVMQTLWARRYYWRIQW